METKVARGITFLIHPLLIPTYVLLVLLNLNVFVSHSVPITYRLALTGMVFLTTFVFPLFFTWLLYRLEMISSLLLVRREERIYPILAISIFY
jgi:hypothetical protein